MNKTPQYPFDPWQLFVAALKAYPKARIMYALLAALCLVVIALSVFRVSAEYAVFGTVIVFALLVVAALTLAATRLSRDTVYLPALALTWSILVLLDASLVFLFTGYFFNWPRAIRPDYPIVPNASASQPTPTTPPSILSPSAPKPAFAAINGRIYTFAPPGAKADDNEIAPSTMLSLVRTTDLSRPEVAKYFAPGTTTPLMRNLDATKFYIACRFPQMMSDHLRHYEVTVTNLRDATKQAKARIVEHGPPKTDPKYQDVRFGGNPIGISPALAKELALNKFDEIQISFDQN